VFSFRLIMHVAFVVFMLFTNFYFPIGERVIPFLLAVLMLSFIFRRV
jgi:hypothetical protein